MPSASHPSCILLQMIITCFLILDNGLPWWLSNKESTYNAGDMGREDPQGREMAAHSNSCLGNPMDRGACWALVQGVSRVRHDLGTKPPPPILRYLCRLKLYTLIGYGFLILECTSGCGLLNLYSFGRFLSSSDFSAPSVTF